MDKISIIVPIYNREKYLRQCIDSILNQTHTNLELILIDDGSEDDSSQICDEYGQKDARVIVKHQPNRGVSAARNAGLDLATGDYIAFVDSDDYIEERMYECLLSMLKSNDADMAICNLQQFDDEGNYYKKPTCIKDEITDGYAVLSRLTAKSDWAYVMVYNRLYKREIFKEIRYPVGKIREDEFIALPVYAMCEKIVITQDVYYFYRINGGSIMANVTSAKHLDVIEAMYHRFLECQRRGWNDLLPSTYNCARNCLEILKNMEVRTKEDKMRRKEIIRMYRYMMKNAQCAISFKQLLVGMFPVLYFKVKKILK